MKKMNFFKILMSLALTLVVSGVFAQNQPSSSTAGITDITSMWEVIKLGNGTLGDGAGSTATGSFTNYVTVSGNFDLTTYDHTLATPALAYSNSGGTGITHYIPLVVIPDQVLNSGSYLAGAITPGSITSTWTWVEGGAASSLVGVDAIDANYVAWEAAAGDGLLYLTSNYYTNYVQVGTNALEADFTVTAAENSMNAAMDNLLCTGATAGVLFDVVAQPSIALNATGTIDDCESNLDGNTYDLVLDLVGTPPFFIAYSYTKTCDINGNGSTADVGDIVSEYRYVVTGSADAETSADLYWNSAAYVAPTWQITGTLNGLNYAWTYTIPVTVNVGGTTWDLDVSDEITEHDITARMISDHNSRKSDRLGSGVDADYLNHVLYASGAASMVITEYPTPITGNIFTLPN